MEEAQSLEGTFLKHCACGQFECEARVVEENKANRRGTNARRRYRGELQNFFQQNAEITSRVSEINCAVAECDNSEDIGY
jgi:hypothetical protein